jgi:hypothetical protein
MRHQSDLAQIAREIPVVLVRNHLALRRSLPTDTARRTNGLPVARKTPTAPYFAGHCDWRLPTIVELATIRLAGYPCGTNPCIVPVFGPTPAIGYWSATTVSPGLAWVVSFVDADGYVYPGGKDNDLAVRAVRAGS